MHKCNELHTTAAELRDPPHDDPKVKRFKVQLRAVLEKHRAAPPATVLVELLMDAAAVHYHLRVDGDALSRQDFSEWADAAWRKVEAIHHGPVD